MRRHTRWMRRTALLACLVGLAVMVGGYLAMGAAGDEKTQNLTGPKSVVLCTRPGRIAPVSRVFADDV